MGAAPTGQENSQREKIERFLKMTAAGGLMVLLPVLLLCLLLAEMLQLIVALANPIAGMLAEGGLEKAANPVLVALVLLVGASIVIGLAMQSGTGRQLGRWFERATLKRLTLLDTNIGDLSRALSHWGVGTASLAAMKISSGG